MNMITTACMFIDLAESNDGKVVLRLYMKLWNWLTKEQYQYFQTNWTLSFAQNNHRVVYNCCLSVSCELYLQPFLLFIFHCMCTLQMSISTRSWTIVKCVISVSKIIRQRFIPINTHWNEIRREKKLINEVAGKYMILLPII